MNKNQQENADTHKNILSFLQDIVFDWDSFLKTIGDLTIIQTYNLFTIRLQSIPAVLLAFLKGQRRRNYETAFEDYGIKVIDNFIFETKKKLEKSFPEMADVALKSTQSPTTLWLDAAPEKAREQLHSLIACGQFTMCYKILEYINKVSRDNNTSMSSQMQ